MTPKYERLPIGWSVIDDETYDGPPSPIGVGATKEEALADLLWQLPDED